jgi:CRP-like cAMP-binding protein
VTAADFPILRTLGADERGRLISAGHARRFAAREVVFHEGDPGDTLHLVVSGRLAVRVTTPLGHTATLTMLGPGDVFGELALLTPDARRTATVVALERTHTLALGSARVATLRREHPQIDRFLTGLLARHLSRTSSLVVEALYLPVETRLARRLSQLARVYDGDIRLTQDDLASMAGTSRATANGVLRTLEDRGVLALRRGRISVLDPAALERAGR